MHELMHPFVNGHPVQDEGCYGYPSAQGWPKSYFGGPPAEPCEADLAVMSHATRAVLYVQDEGLEPWTSNAAARWNAALGREVFTVVRSWP